MTFTWLEHSEMRLYAAAVVFWLAGAALGSIWLFQMMAGCAFFGLAAIPIRVIFAAVEIAGLLADSWTGRKFLGTRP
jgi:hypothetical protein